MSSLRGLVAIADRHFHTRTRLDQRFLGKITSTLGKKTSPSLVLNGSDNPETNITFLLKLVPMTGLVLVLKNEKAYEANIRRPERNFVKTRKPGRNFAKRKRTLTMPLPLMRRTSMMTTNV